jgi:hypothetical protein
MNQPRPNFFVIGASKCGTTFLCKRLSEHPEVFFSVPKEPMYFTRGEELGISADDYAALFAEARGFQAIGEGSTNYAAVSLFPGVERRIADSSPDARIIYMVRHPLERMESQWIQRRATGTTRLDFDRALRELPEMIETNLFWQTASAYRAFFPDRRMLVLFLEDLRADPGAMLRRCFDFLGLASEVDTESPGEAPNPRGGLREDGFLLRAFRRLPVYNALRDLLVPPAWRESVRRRLERREPLAPVWNPGSFDWVVGRIREDNRAFLRHYGKPDDFWDYGRSWLEARGRETGS